MYAVLITDNDGTTVAVGPFADVDNAHDWIGSRRTDDWRDVSIVTLVDTDAGF